MVALRLPTVVTAFAGLVRDIAPVYALYATHARPARYRYPLRFWIGYRYPLLYRTRAWLLDTIALIDTRWLTRVYVCSVDIDSHAVTVATRFTRTVYHSFYVWCCGYILQFALRCGLVPVTLRALRYTRWTVYHGCARCPARSHTPRWLRCCICPLPGCLRVTVPVTHYPITLFTAFGLRTVPTHLPPRGCLRYMRSATHYVGLHTVPGCWIRLRAVTLRSWFTTLLVGYTRLVALFTGRVYGCWLPARIDLWLPLGLIKRAQTYVYLVTLHSTRLRIPRPWLHHCFTAYIPGFCDIPVTAHTGSRFALVWFCGYTVLVTRTQLLLRVCCGLRITRYVTHLYTTTLDYITLFFRFHTVDYGFV